MSIAEKLTTIAENTPKVYNQGYEDGKNSVVDYLPFTKTVQFHSLNDFGKAEVELNFINLQSLSSFCYENQKEYVNTTVEHITINGGAIVSINQMLSCHIYIDTTLKRVTLNVDFTNCSAFGQAFRGRSALEIIDGNPFDFSTIPSPNALTNMFMSCESLVEFRVVANTLKYNWNISNCPNLSADTIQSVINGLADLTDSDTQTLTLHADVGAKLTDEQKTTITAKNWTLAY